MGARSSSFTDPAPPQQPQNIAGSDIPPEVREGMAQITSPGTGTAASGRRTPIRAESTCLEVGGVTSVTPVVTGPGVEAGARPGAHPNAPLSHPCGVHRSAYRMDTLKVV